MDFHKIIDRAKEIRDKYAKIEQGVYGRPWGALERTQGLVVDIGNLMKLVMVKNKLRTMENVDEKLKHELADCFWPMIIIADELGVDLEKSFFDTMN